MFVSALVRRFPVVQDQEGGSGCHRRMVHRESVCQPQRVSENCQMTFCSLLASVKN